VVLKAGRWLGSEQLAALKRAGANLAKGYIGFGRLLEDIPSRALSRQLCFDPVGTIHP